MIQVLQILLKGALAYTALLIILRISGKRTLSKMNAFDLVVTIAIGSTLSTVILDKQISLAEGVAALALLVLLQYVITWISVRWEFFQALVKAKPTGLVMDGLVQEEKLKRERVSTEELHAALRRHGYTLENVAFVVLETDGSFSVMGRDAGLPKELLNMDPSGGHAPRQQVSR